jgi:cellulose synthase operon protein C
MKLSPEAPAVLHAATLLAVKQRQFDRALSYCRKAQLADSAEALGYRLEGDVFSAQLLWQQAIASYRTALTKQNIGTVPSALHNALMRAGKQADAAAFAATWLRQHPDDASFRLRLANLAMERNDLETAETGLRRVVTQQPDSVEALNNLAHVLVLQNKKGAVKMAQAAFNLAPNRADVVDTLAQAQATEGQLDDAIETQLLAKKLAPQSPLMHFNLVRLYLKAGQTSKAREALESASSEPWSSQRAKDIEALRQQLKG